MAFCHIFSSSQIHFDIGGLSILKEQNTPATLDRGTIVNEYNGPNALFCDWPIRGWLC